MPEIHSILLVIWQRDLMSQDEWRERDWEREKNAIKWFCIKHCGRLRKTITFNITITLKHRNTLTHSSTHSLRHSFFCRVNYARNIHLCNTNDHYRQPTTWPTTIYYKILCVLHNPIWNAGVRDAYTWRSQNNFYWSNHNYYNEFLVMRTCLIVYMLICFVKRGARGKHL